MSNAYLGGGGPPRVSGSTRIGKSHRLEVAKPDGGGSDSGTIWAQDSLAKGLAHGSVAHEGLQRSRCLRASPSPDGCRLSLRKHHGPGARCAFAFWDKVRGPSGEGGGRTEGGIPTTNCGSGGTDADKRRGPRAQGNSDGGSNHDWPTSPGASTPKTFNDPNGVGGISPWVPTSKSPRGPWSWHAHSRRPPKAACTNHAGFDPAISDEIPTPNTHSHPGIKHPPQDPKAPPP